MNAWVVWLTSELAVGMLAHTGRFLRRLRPTTTMLPTTTAASLSTQREAPPPTSWTAKGKAFLKEYGTVGLVTHTTLSLLSYSLLYVSVTKGLDVGAFLDSWRNSVAAANATTSSDGVHTASNAVVTYALYKMLAPIRWPLTFFVTPVVVKQWKKFGSAAKKTDERPKSDL
ncbi:hypothetical protein SDRG_00038 [Saprolegnia diclina VS20]|uniref:DUF1279 domain-containing protein n=1 Tax=Saprolegnia diclina (strain VS20) TaxID=1156394 RepID=T0QVP3_SAPDV|nr:hypothetical protein SDRG_00038 [Saprolegnia diclina VS20]EQC42299.1 hypothetical protein SDRG_00038 [Saprolegnia diclina VS20]|eukprot:XP_008603722.1 hypothetical protein SDRG_00038 [Saprolegnia diclina VS20]